MTGSKDQKNAKGKGTNKKKQPSFFDGMEELDTHEKIDMSILDEVKPLAPEYLAEDMDSIKKLIKD